MDTNKSTYTDQVAPLQLTSRTIHDQFVSRDMSQRWGRNVLNPRLTITSYQDSPAITIASAAPVVPWMTTVKKSPAPRRNTLKEFAKASSLHGIKYLAEEDRHFTEIIFWSVANGLAFICVVYFICEVFFLWTQAPIVITHGSRDANIREIPFPSITICNMNKVRRSHVRQFQKNERELVKDICELDNLYQDLPVNRTAFRVFAEKNVITGNSFVDFKFNLGIPCNEMLLLCVFSRRKVNCSDLFSDVLTDGGRCCTFNTMPESVMFRTKMNDNDSDVVEKWQGWNVQHGYPDDQSYGIPHLEDHRMPMRTTVSGLHGGLSVLLDTRPDEQACIASESVGFRGLLHSPSSWPRVSDFGFAVHPGMEVFSSVSPSVLTTEPAVHRYKATQRRCYLQHERNLTFYSNYNLINCLTECHMKLMIQRCGCVPYNQPPHFNTSLCTMNQFYCTRNGGRTRRKSGLHMTHEIDMSDCGCLPSCTKIDYFQENSYSKMREAWLFSLPKDLKARPELNDDEYVSNSLTMLHVFYKKPSFMLQKRKERFGSVDLFSRLGGLLGLCLGSSVASWTEFVYFFTIREYLHKSRGH